MGDLPGMRGSGLSELKVILNGFKIGKFLDLIIFSVKFLCLPLSVSSLSLGKDAPLIHLSCCLANYLCQWFPKFRYDEARKRELLSAASAAGVATAFGAPIGGVLLSLEGLSTFFPSKTMLRSFFCALIASVTVQFLDPYQGKRVLYQVSYTRNWLLFETSFFILLGVLGGLLGSFLVRLYKIAVSYRLTMKTTNPVVEAGILAGLTSLVSYINIFTRIDGSELLESLYRECSPTEHLGLCSREVKLNLILSLSWSLLVNVIFSIMAYSSNLVPGGLFAPSMVCGAILGRILGEMIQYLQSAFPQSFLFSTCPRDSSCITPGVYALLGSLAVFSGFTKLSVSVIVIMFELTGTLNFVVPCMITLMVAKLTGDLIEKDGFLESVIIMKGFPFLDPRKESTQIIAISDRMTPLMNLSYLYQGISYNDLEKITNLTKFRGYPVVNNNLDWSFMGYIEREDIVEHIEELKRANITVELSKYHISFTSETKLESQRSGVNWINLESYVNQTPLSLDPAVPMEFVDDLFKKMGPRYIIVKKMGQLVGLFTKKDLLNSYDESKNYLLHSKESRISVFAAEGDVGSEGFKLSPDLRFRPLTLEEERVLLE